MQAAAPASPLRSASPPNAGNDGPRGSFRVPQYMFRIAEMLDRPQAWLR
jgi:hypothetical protein